MDAVKDFAFGLLSVAIWAVPALVYLDEIKAYFG